MFELRISLRPTADSTYGSLVSELLKLFDQLQLDDVVESSEWVGEEGSRPTEEDALLAASSWSIFRETQAEVGLISDQLKNSKIFPMMAIILRDIGESGWQSVWQDAEISQSVGRFRLILDPVLAAPQTDANEWLPIIMQPGRASFGSGQHSTTRACLLALSKLSTVRQLSSCLDIGSGNGVLAIAAARMGVSQIIATEIDAVVISDARQNAGLNHVEIDFRLDPTIPSGKFDLMFCNILLPELLRVLPDLADRASRGSHILLAGFHSADADRVVEVAHRFGLGLKWREMVNEWPCLVFEGPRDA
jgi:ribosomal protein L11 methylase PrmA